MVRSLRDAGSIRESNNLIVLHDAILAMRAHSITNLSACWNEEIDSPLRQVISVGRIERHGARVVGKSTGGVQVAI